MFRPGGASRLKCLVTGPTGFIGSALCEALRAAGHEVMGLVRHADGTPGEMQHIVHDLCRPMPETLSLQGVDVVVHTAGIAHQQAAAERHVVVNEKASIALAQRAARDGVRRFVYLSSVKAMGPAATESPRAESQVTAPVGAYAASKRRAEIALAQLASGSCMQMVSLRPALVYGAGVGGNLATLRSWVKRGLPLVPEAGGRSMVSRDDLVRLLVAFVASDAPILPEGGALWNVTDGEVYSTRRLMLALATAMQRPVPRLELPATCWRFLGSCVDLRRGAPLGTTASALFGSELFDSRAVCEATGWRPQQRFEDVAPAIVRATAAT